jgi:hypothetical protein
MESLRDFYNDGFGWICRQCERELAAPDDSARSRLLSEGESEGKNPRLSTIALARWADKTHRTLICPRCGITEPVEPS